MKLSKINLRKVKGFISRYRISVTIVVIAIIAAVAITYYFLSQTQNVTFSPLKLKQKVETKVAAPLTGELVDPAVINRRPLAVIIENFTEARPQSGYNDADIVYETLAEGGITRTLAIYQSKTSTEIGPVRSARAYFVDWLTSFDAIFAHVGGSSEAISLLQTIGTDDLNQFFNADYFWRSNDRYAPHNVYTTTDKLYAAAKANKYEVVSNIKSLKFKKDAFESARPASQSINIDFSYDDYSVQYNYDLKTNTYLRSIAGVAAKDKNTGVQVAPKNIIVEYTTVTSYVSAAGEQGVHIGDTGNGTGYLFQDGKAEKITWSKVSRATRTKYVTAEGKEIELNPGQTWIEVVPVGNSVTY